MSDVLNRARYKGETFVVVRNGEQVATLGPAKPPRGVAWREFVEMMKDVPRSGADFADDLEAIQASQPPIPQPPSWD